VGSTSRAALRRSRPLGAASDSSGNRRTPRSRSPGFKARPAPGRSASRFVRRPRRRRRSGARRRPGSFRRTAFDQTPRWGSSFFQIEGPVRRLPVRLHGIPSQVFICQPQRPGRGAFARKILIWSALARRAYRRPVTADDPVSLVSFLPRARSNRRPSRRGIGLALESTLESRRILIRIESIPTRPRLTLPYRISPAGTASSAVVLLWSRKMPDDDLPRARRAGKLTSPDLRAPVRRMRAKPRSKALITNFAGHGFICGM